MKELRRRILYSADPILVGGQAKGTPTDREWGEFIAPCVNLPDCRGWLFGHWATANSADS